MTDCVYNGMFLTTYEEITQIMFLIMPFIGSMKQYRFFYTNYLKGRRVLHGLIIFQIALFSICFCNERENVLLEFMAVHFFSILIV